MVNMKNVKKWTDALRDPANKQVNGVLIGEWVGGWEPGDEKKVGYCCLGLGCVVAEIGRVDVDPDSHHLPALVHAGMRYASLPPATFHQWLGLTLPGHLPHERALDVEVDWPTRTDHNGDEQAFWSTQDGDEMHFSCAELNDECHLTFPQIADVIDYFGLKDVE